MTLINCITNSSRGAAQRMNIHHCERWSFIFYTKYYARASMSVCVCVCWTSSSCISIYFLLAFDSIHYILHWSHHFVEHTKDESNNERKLNKNQCQRKRNQRLTTPNIVIVRAKCVRVNLSTKIRAVCECLTSHFGHLKIVRKFVV